MTKTVKACPVCGLEYMAHCFHEGQNVYTEEMTPSEALKLVIGTIGDMRTRLDEMNETKDKYERMLDGESPPKKLTMNKIPKKHRKTAKKIMKAMPKVEGMERSISLCKECDQIIGRHYIP